MLFNVSLDMMPFEEIVAPDGRVVRNGSERCRVIFTGLDQTAADAIMSRCGHLGRGVMVETTHQATHQPGVKTSFQSIKQGFPHP